MAIIAIAYLVAAAVVPKGPLMAQQPSNGDVTSKVVEDSASDNHLETPPDSPWKTITIHGNGAPVTASAISSPVHPSSEHSLRREPESFLFGSVLLPRLAVK